MRQAALDGDLSAAFGRASRFGLLYKFRDLGVNDAIFDVVAGFLSGRVQRVVIEGVCSVNEEVVSGIPQGSVMGPLLFLLYTSDLPIIQNNTLVAYADNSTLLA